MTGEPLPQCQFTVERAYEGEGPAYECVNRKFFDCSDTAPRRSGRSTCATRSASGSRARDGRGRVPPYLADSPIGRMGRPRAARRLHTLARPAPGPA